METYDIDNEALKAVCFVTPLLKNFFSEDIAISVSDRKNYLRTFWTESLGIKSNSGDPINPNGADFEAMKYDKVVVKIIPKEVFGSEIKNISVPIKDENGKIIGCFAIARSLTRSREIANLSQSIAHALSQLTDATNNISLTAQKVSESNSTIVKDVNTTSEQTKNTDKIIGFVKNVASQTNLLGLNASIEAARAGELGKGFNVVANEIRKLSSSSSQSIKQIEDDLKRIHLSVQNINRNISEIDSAFTEQSHAFQEINAVIQELSASAQLLENMAKEY